LGQCLSQPQQIGAGGGAVLQWALCISVYVCRQSQEGKYCGITIPVTKYRTTIEGDMNIYITTSSTTTNPLSQFYEYIHKVQLNNPLLMV